MACNSLAVKSNGLEWLTRMTVGGLTMFCVDEFTRDNKKKVIFNSQTVGGLSTLTNDLAACRDPYVSLRMHSHTASSKP